jgi:hypothetical protein
MASDVRVEVDDIAIISALNTPGGGVYEWRDGVGHDIAMRAMITSPINNPLNAVHREGVVGTYKKSWAWGRQGSNGHRVRAIVFNSADHAEFVEFGRSASNKYQRFSWSRWNGDIRSVGGVVEGRPRLGTRSRDGKHILRNACNSVMPGATGGTYTPLA